MLNSTILEVAAGLVFTFLSVSMATSAILEAIASVLEWRSRTLLAGVKDLVNDADFTGLAKTLYSHALVNPRGPGGSAPTKNMPAYIDSQRFAEALLDIAGLTDALRPAAGGTPNLAAAHAAIDRAIPLRDNAQINDMLHGAIQRGLGDFDAAKNELAAWFDTGMDGLSGAYKRWSQLVGFFVALILCFLLNIDTVHIARTLWVDPGIADKAAAKQADASGNMQQLLDTFPVGWPEGLLRSIAAKRREPPSPAPSSSTSRAPGQPQAQPEVQKPGETAGQVTALVPGAGTTGEYGDAIIGWIITAFATLFGAPFWFDALQSVIRLKGAGPSPLERKNQKAAAD